jgi:hypothetical protein
MPNEIERELLNAALEGNEKKIRELRKLKADGKTVDFAVEDDSYMWLGWNPLHYAVWHNKINAVKVLIEIGTSIDGKNYLERLTGKGWVSYGLKPPLILALEKGYITIAYLLLINGASELTKDQEGMCAKDKVDKQSNQALKDMFLLYRMLNGFNKQMQTFKSDATDSILKTFEEYFNRLQSLNGFDDVQSDLKSKFLYNKALVRFYSTDKLLLQGKDSVAQKALDEAMQELNLSAEIFRFGGEFFVPGTGLCKYQSHIPDLSVMVNVRQALIKANYNCEKIASIDDAFNEAKLDSLLKEANEHYNFALTKETSPEMERYIKDKIEAVNVLFQQFEFNKYIQKEKKKGDILCEEAEDMLNEEKLEAATEKLKAAAAVLELTLSSNSLSEKVRNMLTERIEEIKRKENKVKAKIFFREATQFFNNGQANFHNQAWDLALGNLRSALNKIREAFRLDDKIENALVMEQQINETIRKSQIELSKLAQLSKNIEERLKDAENYDLKAKDLLLHHDKIEDTLQYFDLALQSYREVFDRDQNSNGIGEKIKEVETFIFFAQIKLLYKNAINDKQDCNDSDFYNLKQANEGCLELLNGEYDLKITQLHSKVFDLQDDISYASANALFKKAELLYEQARQKFRAKENNEAIFYLNEKSERYCERALKCLDDHLKRRASINAQELRDKVESFRINVAKQKEKLPYVAQAKQNKHVFYFREGLLELQEGFLEEAMKSFKCAIDCSPIFFEAKYNFQILQILQKIKEDQNSSKMRQNSQFRNHKSVGIISNFEYASMSDHVYSFNSQGTSESQSKLPEGWRVHIHSRNDHFDDSDSHYIDNDGFFAVAYVNDKKKKVVIAYRGTDLSFIEKLDVQSFHNLFHNLQADISLFFGAKSSTFSLAYEFFCYIATWAKSKNYKLSLTGHSLGAALAEVMAIEQEVDAVTFESPGALEFIRTEQIEKLRNLGSNAFSIKSYVSEPNLVNTGKTHLGVAGIRCAELIRIFPIIHVLKHEEGKRIEATIGIKENLEKIDNWIIEYGKKGRVFEVFPNELVRQGLPLINGDIDKLKQDILKKAEAKMRNFTELCVRTLTAHSMHSILKSFEYSQRQNFSLFEEKMRKWPTGFLTCFNYHQFLKRDESFIAPLPSIERPRDRYFLEEVCHYQTEKTYEEYKKKLEKDAKYFQGKHKSTDSQTHKRYGAKL